MKAGILKIGFDLGTNTSVVAIHDGAKEVKLKSDIIFTVVGYAKSNLLPGVLPDNRTTFYGEEAVQHRRYLDLKWPVEKGVVKDVTVARDFLTHVRSLVDGQEVWAVVGEPGATTPSEKESLRMALGNRFARFLIVPEPFLAALGIRDESKLGQPGYIDPVRHSIIVDVGAGTTDLCLLQGFYPSADDQTSFPKAGNDIDKALREMIERKYPDVKLHNVSVTRVKEQNSYVGTPKKKITMKLFIHGKEREFDVTELVGQACAIVVPEIVEHILNLTKRCDQEIADQILGNIILTGGGSQIDGLAELVEARLKENGLATAKVARAQDYKRLVARGALKVGQMARDDQWQLPSLT